MPLSLDTLYWVRLEVHGRDGGIRIVAEVSRRGLVGAQEWREHVLAWCKYNPPADGARYHVPLPSTTRRSAEPAALPQPTARRRRRRRVPQAFGGPS
jgi:hypothetical protein